MGKVHAGAGNRNADGISRKQLYKKGVNNPEAMSIKVAVIFQKSKITAIFFYRKEGSAMIE